MLNQHVLFAQGTFSLDLHLQFTNVHSTEGEGHFRWRPPVRAACPSPFLLTGKCTLNDHTEANCPELASQQAPSSQDSRPCNELGSHGGSSSDNKCGEKTKYRQQLVPTLRAKRTMCIRVLGFTDKAIQKMSKLLTLCGGGKVNVCACVCACV